MDDAISNLHGSTTKYGKAKSSQKRRKYFITETGVPQGSSEGAITWLILFDVLLTLIRKANASDLYIKDPNGSLRKQWPTAFADDLMT